MKPMNCENLAFNCKTILDTVKRIVTHRFSPS
jgi:hypothetical protein